MADPLFNARGPLFSLTPFPLHRETLDLIQRCGVVLSRFHRAASLVDLRSSRGSLPPWISALARRGALPAGVPAPCRTRLFQATFRLAGPEGRISLTGWQTRHDGIGPALWLQQTSGSAGNGLIGGTEGIPEGLHRLAANGGTLLFSQNTAQSIGEREWIAGRNIPGLTSLPVEGEGPLFSENRTWLGLLCSPPLQAIWARELRASNLRFLRKLLAPSWTVDPAPIPHQAVLPGLGKRTFAEATLPDPSECGCDWTLQSILRRPGLPVVIRSRVSAGQWRQTLDRALADFDTAPWLLQKRPFFTGTPVTLRATGPEPGGELPITGEPELQVHYLESDGRIALAGILAGIDGTAAGVPTTRRQNRGGEEENRTLLFAPCGPAGADS